MSVVSYALTTVAKVKLALDIPTADTSSDSKIEAFINQVTDFIEGFCAGRRFLSTAYANEIYDSPCGRNVFLHQFPVTALSAVEYRSGTWDSPTWNTYFAGGYLLYGKSGYVKFAAMLPEISQGLRFSYTAGYLIDFTQETNPLFHTLPFDITQVATELVSKKMNTSKAGGISSMATEGQSVTFSSKKDLDQDQNAVLMKYRAHRFAI